MTEPIVRMDPIVVVKAHELDFEKIYLDDEEACEVL